MLSYAMHFNLLAVVLLLTTSTSSTPASYDVLNKRATNQYAPISVKCPSQSLVRPATSINAQESSYVSSRRSKANAGLGSWLQKQGKFSTSSLPVVAFSSSGGGYRALLETAGVVQGFDIRDSDFGTSKIPLAKISKSHGIGGVLLSPTLYSAP